MNNILPIIQLNSSTFSQDIVTNPMRSIAVEIGDSKQSTFYPQFKTMHWNNDANFSMRLVTPLSGLLQNPIVTNLAGKISWQHGNIKAGIYAKDTGDEDGGYEFDVTLNSKPLTNILNFTIQSKNLDFFYQPALTADEIAKGVVCADNVIGSYAVYHNSKRDNLVGGMEYRTGKAFHIYRPFATDAKGQTTWCDLNIDTVSNTASITIPQTFLDTAMYPIVVDPTFGYTSVGASYQQMGTSSYGIGIALKYTVTTGFSVTDERAYVYITNTYGVGGTMQAAIYDDSSGSPYNRLALSSSVTPSISPAWYTFSNTTSPQGAGDYWLHLNENEPGGLGNHIQWAYDTGTIQTATDNDDSYITNANPWAGITSYSGTQVFSIYATYTAVTPPTTNNTNFFFT